ncbi:unnamed protein product [Cuscuta epithymum]|nr:unnamed protein product [Cuscuta epithymum]
MIPIRGQGVTGMNKKADRFSQETSSGSSGRSTSSAPSTLPRRNTTLHSTLSPTHSRPSLPFTIPGRNSTPYSTPSLSHSKKHQPLSSKGGNITPQAGQTRQSSQPPPSQYHLPRVPSPNITAVTKRQPTISPTQGPNKDPTLLFNQDSPSTTTSSNELEDSDPTTHSNGEDELGEWNPDAYKDLEWGEEPLDHFRSLAIAKFERPNVGLNASKVLVNIVSNKTSLRFQTIASRQIRYNLHPAGQQWKWVPQKTKDLYWDQFQDLVNWDISKFKGKDIRKGYENYLKQRAYSNIMSKIRERRPLTVNDFTWGVVEEFRGSATFQRLSESGKKNRIAGGDRCKQYGGSRSAADLAEQESSVSGEEVNPLKICVTYHPRKRKNGEVIDYGSQSEVMEAIFELSDEFNENIQQAKQSETENGGSNTASKAVVAELNSKYLEIAGGKNKKVFGLGKYAKAFLQKLESKYQKASASSQRAHEFCVYWDEHMRKWLSSQGEECPPVMPLVDESLLDEDPCSQPKAFEQTWLPFLKTLGMDAPSFFQFTPSSSPHSQST